MMLQRFTHRLLSHRWEALLLTAAVACVYFLPFGSLISSFAMIFAALVTLVRGPKEGAIFSLAAVIPYVATAFLSGGWFGLVPTPDNMLGVFIIGNILTYVSAVLLYQRTSWSQIIQVEALLGVFAISVIHLVFPEVTDWWTKNILASYMQFKQILLQMHLDNLVALLPDLQESAAMAAQIATGTTVVLILLVNFVQLYVARLWQYKVEQMGSLGKELNFIRFGQLAGFFFIASIVLLYLGNVVITDILPVLLLAFGLAGLSLLNFCFSLMQRSASKIFLMVLVYSLIIFFIQVGSALLACFAWMDIWLDLRRRFKPIH